MSAWTNFPTAWIIADKKLDGLSWHRYKADAIAALLILIALAIKRNMDRMGIEQDERIALSNNEYVKATYDDLQDMLLISRSKVANGIALLIGFNIIERAINNKSLYKLTGCTQIGKWAKLPQGILMRGKRLTGFDSFTLRSKNELNALKLYLLMIAFRNTKTSYASLGYSAFTEYTGVQPNDIKKAKSHLINLNLISVEANTDFVQDKTKPSLRYKLTGL